MGKVIGPVKKATPNGGGGKHVFEGDEEDSGGEVVGEDLNTVFAGESEFRDRRPFANGDFFVLLAVGGVE